MRPRFRWPRIERGCGLEYPDLVDRSPGPRAQVQSTHDAYGTRRLMRRRERRGRV
jgi:hypothetical protein